MEGPSSAFPPLSLSTPSHRHRPRSPRPPNIPPERWPEIRLRVAQGLSLRQVAAEYHTSYQTIWRIVHRPLRDG
ncbi:helix-turn-helix domain-containing protein [Thermogemmatispora sp.]|uniref:helix-turn-helix domain-containing protein n=1 Tax=Thermogemmatispora sp. TaxID=1968838 RepID=UPI0034515DFC